LDGKNTMQGQGWTWSTRHSNWHLFFYSLFLPNAPWLLGSIMCLVIIKANSFSFSRSTEIIVDSFILKLNPSFIT
jgi:uncharacterized membrane protein